MRISDWSSDVCSSDLAGRTFAAGLRLRASVQMEVMVSLGRLGEADYEGSSMRVRLEAGEPRHIRFTTAFRAAHPALKLQIYVADLGAARGADLMVDSLCVGSLPPQRSEEHTSELQSLMRISYAVFCLNKKTQNHSHIATNIMT